MEAIKKLLLDKLSESFSLQTLGEIKEICDNWLTNKHNDPAKKNGRLVVYVLHGLCSDAMGHIHKIEQRTSEHQKIEQVIRPSLEALINQIGADDLVETIAALDNAIIVTTRLGGTVS